MPTITISTADLDALTKLLDRVFDAAQDGYKPNPSGGASWDFKQATFPLKLNDFTVAPGFRKQHGQWPTALDVARGCRDAVKEALATTRHAEQQVAERLKDIKNEYGPRVEVRPHVGVTFCGHGSFSPDAEIERGKEEAKRALAFWNDRGTGMEAQVRGFVYCG